MRLWYSAHLKLQTRFAIIKMPVKQVIHSYLSSFLYPASTGSCFMKARQRKEKNKKYLKERYEEEMRSIFFKNKDGLYQGEDIDDIQMIDRILKLNL